MGKTFELRDGEQALPFSSGRHTNEDRSLLSLDLDARQRRRKLILKVLDPGQEVGVPSMYAGTLVHLPHGSTVVSGWQQVGELNTPWKSVFFGFDRDDCIQSEQGKVGQIVLGDALTALGCDDETETPKAGGAATGSTQLRDEDLVGISNNDLLDLTPSGDQQTELPSALPAELTESSGSLRVDEGVLGNPSPVQALDSLGLVGLEALGIAVKFGRNEIRPWCR